MPKNTRLIYPITALFFFLSGFCGLLYQIVWMRLAYASFGIITPVMSVVLSVFMAGLALGSWWGGRLAGRWANSPASVPLLAYAMTEFLIGLGAFLVPSLFTIGNVLLLSAGDANTVHYLFLSAIVLLLSLLPWCVCMGATFPFMLAFLKKLAPQNDGFSFLYNANVFGAMAGTFFSALVLIELLGFRGTLVLGACLNAFICVFSVLLARKFPSAGLSRPSRRATKPATYREAPVSAPTGTLLILFSTGFISMAMEVIWTRAFTVVLRTQVYSFASILFVYLLFTFAGTWLYRRHLRRGSVFTDSSLLGSAFAFCFLPLVLNDLRWHISIAMVLASVAPFCAVLGYLTPKLVDRFSKGGPSRAGTAYALNVVGCILGPLAASYLLLPWFSCRVSIILSALPIGWLFAKTMLREPRFPWPARIVWVTVGICLFLVSAVSARSYEEVFRTKFQEAVVKRDYAGTVVSCIHNGLRDLFVNGISITGQVAPTKVMAHLPAVFLPRPPESALVICFGMGTTYRSLCSWNIAVTAVELVPGVFRSFPYFYPDSSGLVSGPRNRMVVDDGRRFLQRTDAMFDIITLDPPPPLEAAGSSLLYSTEFYDLVKKRLKKDGILQQWMPLGENKIFQAITRSLVVSFPYVRAFHSPGYGVHFLASLSPIPAFSARDLAKKLPPLAQADVMEWHFESTPERYFEAILSKEIALDALLNPDKRIIITDGKPLNEYFLLRRGSFASMFQEIFIVSK